MSPTRKRLYSLLSAQHDGCMLSDAEQRELAALLESGEQAQFDYFQIERMFHDLEGRYIGNCANTLVSELPNVRSKAVSRFAWVAAIAASLVAAFLLVQKPGTGSAGRDADTVSTILMHDESSFVARVVHAADLEWGLSNTVAIGNGVLTSGMLDLAKGSLDVVFDNGARIGFTAPVQMDLTSLRRLLLRSGGLVVDVPGLASGFSIHTPDAVLSANTVRARIQCGHGQATVVNVERGALDLFTENGGGEEIQRKIVGKESVEIARGTAMPVTDTKRVVEPGLDLSRPPELENLQYAHYRFDEERGEKVVNHGNLANADGYLAGLVEHPEYPAPRRVPGRFNRALEFSGHGEGVIADLKEFGSDEPGSVAFWVKLSPELEPGEFENLFTWRMFTTAEKQWHEHDDLENICRIRVNHSSGHGVVGAVRINFRDKWICGDTDLRDGRWHHLTAVFNRDYHGDEVVLTHYLDGKLARCSAWGLSAFPKERYLEIGGGSLTVGRVYWPQRPVEVQPGGPVGLRGMMDEVYVFNQPVLPSHASSLHLQNTPNQVLKVSFVPWTPQPVAMLPGTPDIGEGTVRGAHSARTFLNIKP